MHTLRHSWPRFDLQQLRYSLTAGVLALALAGCAPTSDPEATPAEEQEAPAAVERYPLRGKVLGLNEEDKTATINHEEIPGWMGAMTMGFPVKDDAEWAKLSVGADIEATVFVDDAGFSIGEIKVAEGEEDSPSGEQ